MEIYVLLSWTLLLHSGSNELIRSAFKVYPNKVDFIVSNLLKKKAVLINYETFKNACLESFI